MRVLSWTLSRADVVRAGSRRVVKETAPCPGQYFEFCVCSLRVMGAVSRAAMSWVDGVWEDAIDGAAVVAPVCVFLSV